MDVSRILPKISRVTSFVFLLLFSASLYLPSFTRGRIAGKLNMTANSIYALSCILSTLTVTEQ